MHASPTSRTMTWARLTIVAVALSLLSGTIWSADPRVGNPPVITSASTAQGTVGQSFSYLVVATNAPTSFGATPLPSGLVIDAGTGAITGTPVAAGNTDVTITATNADGTGSALLAIQITTASPTQPPVINSPMSASATVDQSFSYQITATNSPTVFHAVGLPAGLTIDEPSGLISGTPTATGVTAVTIAADNAIGTGTETLTLTVASANAPTITSPLTADATVGVPFTYTITASNSPTTFGASGLPAALVVDTSTGRISGVPSAAGTATVLISASNAGGTSSATLTIGVLGPAPGSPLINSPTSAVATVGAPFTYTITALNNPSSFSAAGLPAGLQLDTASGVISGTPTTIGTSTVTLGATNVDGTTYTGLSLDVVAAGSGGTTISDDEHHNEGCGAGSGVAVLGLLAWLGAMLATRSALCAFRWAPLDDRRSDERNRLA